MVWIFNSYENNTSQRILHVPEGRNFVSFVYFLPEKNSNVLLFYQLYNAV